MQLIKPSLITGEILTLIEEADEKLILISPYCRFRGWNKFGRSLDIAKEKEFDIEFYVRADEPQTSDEVKRIGCNPTEISNLHTKLYFNEKYAIVSSMNLVAASDAKSMDIAHKTETQQEYDDILAYFKRYIRKKPEQIAKFDFDSFKTSVEAGLETNLELRFSVYYSDESLIVNGRNKYFVNFQKVADQFELEVIGILAVKEYYKLSEGKKDYLPITKDKVILDIGGEGRYSTAVYQSKCFVSSNDLDELNNENQDKISNEIVKFITEFEGFKFQC